jgi:hypothetical protein
MKTLRNISLTTSDGKLASLFAKFSHFINSPEAIALIPIVVGLVEVFKNLGFPERFAPLASIAFGVTSGSSSFRRSRCGRTGSLGPLLGRPQDGSSSCRITPLSHPA